MDAASDWADAVLIDFVDAVKAGGGNVRFTVYEGAGHGISGQVYRTKALYEWLLQQGNE